MSQEKRRIQRLLFSVIALLCVSEFASGVQVLLQNAGAGPATVAVATNMMTAALYFAEAVYGLMERKKPDCFSLCVVLVALGLISFLTQVFLAGFTWRRLFFHLACMLSAVDLYLDRRASDGREPFWKNIKYYDDPIIEVETGLETIPGAPSRYRLSGGRIAACADGEAEIMVMTPGEYELSDASEQVKRWLAKLNGERYTTVDVIDDEIFGTLAIPDKNNILGRRVLIRYHLTEDQLVFIDGSGVAASFLAGYAGHQNASSHNMIQLFLNLICHLTYHDDAFFNDYEQRLDLLEDNMVDNVMEIPRDFEEYILQIKKEQRRLMRFYKQTADLVTSIAESEVSYVDRVNRTDMQMVASRLMRLCAESQGMFEYATQIIDTYQAKVNVRQNKIMQLLTIVTTIFMPLTLITGWYGMNFKIPEATWKYGYLIAIISSVVIIAVEVILFRKKKWM